jgi:hypothetical protein
MASLFEVPFVGIGHRKFRHLVNVVTIDRNQIEAVEKLYCAFPAFVVGACLLHYFDVVHGPNVIA